MASSVSRGALAALAALAAVLAGGPGEAATLRQELASMLAGHPRLRAAESSVRSAEEGIRRAFSTYLPRVALSADSGPEYVDTPLRPGAKNLARDKETLTVTQNMFDGFRSGKTYDAAKLRAGLARHELDSTRQSLLFEGISAYYNVLREERLIEIAKQNAETIRQQLNLEDERVRRGRSIQVDVLLAKTRLQLAQERIVQLEGELEEARARYAQLFDHPPSLKDMRQPDLDLSSVPASVEAAQEAATRFNPTLKASNDEIEIADRRRGVAAADFYPRLDLVGTLNRERDVDGVQGVREDWSVLLRMTWELFSGFATSSAVRAATVDGATARSNHSFNRRRVDQDLRLAWSQLQTARRRVGLLDNAAAIAEEVFQARRRLRDVGREDAINTLDAQTELFGAQLNLVAAKFDAEIAAFRVLFVMGRLTPEVLGL